MMIIVIMGVCGSGKTTVGINLAERLKWKFADADEFHSEDNKMKMSSGQALTDEDRLPWLQSIHKYIKRLLQSNQSGVVTCSALKRTYRNVLRYGTISQIKSTTETNLKEKAVVKEADIKYEHLKDTGLCNEHKEDGDIVFVHLNGSREILETRLSSRLGHFMPANMLQSQLDTLENLGSEEKGLTVNIYNTEMEITKAIISQLGI